MLRAVIVALLVLGLPLAGASEDWAGEVAAGYISTEGNSRTRVLNGKLALDYAAEQWKNSFQMQALNAADRQDTTAERYTASDKLDYNFSQKSYVFVVGEYEKDLVGAIRDRTSEAFGYGRHVLTGPKHVLDAELGAGARQTRENVTGLRDADVIGRLSGKYLWQLTDTNVFTQALKVESGEANTFSESVSELKLSIVGNLFSTLSFTLRHNSDVPPDRRRSDTVTAVNLSYTLGSRK